MQVTSRAGNKTIIVFNISRAIAEFREATGWECKKISKKKQDVAFQRKRKASQNITQSTDDRSCKDLYCFPTITGL